MLVTLGLGILVLGLANWLLFMEKKNNYRYSEAWMTKPDEKYSDNGYSNNSNGTTYKILKMNGNLLDKNNYYLERQIRLINTRLAKIENFIASHSNGNNTYHELYKRIERLTEFKRNAEIEIRALRDYLEEKDGAFKKKMEKQDKELEKKIHSLVFNNKKAN